MYMSAHTKQENITRLANYRRISLQEAVTPVEDSIPSFLSLVSSVGLMTVVSRWIVRMG
jgi:hypothetical protein